jgi:uncharacterized protein YcbX
MHVTALHVYPIKGCRGHAVAEAHVDRRGPVGDRRLMLVDANDRFLSQREVPRLATITPLLADRRLEVSIAGAVPLRLTVDPFGPVRSVRIWSDTVTAHDQGDDAAWWFTEVLQMPCRLVAFGEQSRRPIDPEWSPRTDAETTFTDGYPLHLVTEASVAALNAQLDEPVPTDRFRPNVVASGTAAWHEDAWRTLRIGELQFDVVKPCARCVVTSVDQATGARHPHQEPFRTIARERTVPRLGALFGQNLVPRRAGMLRVGDPVEVTA